MTGQHYIATGKIREAVKRREGEVLAALGIRDPGAGHIHCPYPGHEDADPSWRWSSDKGKAFCTCIERSHSIFDVAMAIEGIDFDAAKIRVAEILGREDLIRTRDGNGPRQAFDPASLLNPPADNRDDALPRAYLAHRLGVAPEDVPMPSTAAVGIKALAYFDPPARKGGKPEKVGEFSCAVFETIAADGRRHAHRIYLAPEGRGKADLGQRKDGKRRDPKKSAKMAQGAKTAGCGSVWGDPTKAPHLLAFEGIETGQAAAYVFRAEIEAGEVAVVAAISDKGLRALKPWPATKRVTVGADRDEAKQPGARGYQVGEKEARAFGARNHEQVAVSIALPGAPREKVDWLDILERDGAEAVRAGLLDAQPYEPAPEELEDAQRAEARDTRLATLPQIWPERLGFVETTDAAWRAVERANSPERYFRFAGGFCRISKDEHGATIAEPLNQSRARHALSRCALWFKTGKDEDPREIAPPLETVEDVLATAEPPLPVLQGIVTAPVFAADGTLNTEPGYHPGSKLLYKAETGFVVSPVPAEPGPADIAYARKILEDDVLGDFCFDGPEDGQCEHAHALALILQPFARELIDGSTPIYLIDKPTPGSGAGLLADVASLIATGAPATATTESRDDEEMRKKITGFLMAGKGVFFLDNVNRRVDSAALASAVTTKFYEDRVLGQSRLARMPVRNAWIIAGNNVRTSNEIARRCVRIRLDPKTDRPEERTGFRHDSLPGWVLEQRASIVWACLVLIKAWIAAGRPSHQGKVLGSFEAWCRTMGGILEVAGVSGFLGNLTDMRSRVDQEGAALRAFVGLWWGKHGTAEVAAADLYPTASESEPALPLGEGNEKSQRSRLGRMLSRIRDRQFRIPVGPREVEVRVEFAGILHKASRWSLVAVEGNVWDLDPGAAAPSPADNGELLPLENQSSPQSSPVFSQQNQCSGELGELGELNTGPRAYARDGSLKDTNENVRIGAGDPEKSSPSSPSSPGPCNPRVSGGELSGELLSEDARSSPDGDSEADSEPAGWEGRI